MNDDALHCHPVVKVPDLARTSVILVVFIIEREVADVNSM
jgi:hypothetical protein